MESAEHIEVGDAVNLDLGHGPAVLAAQASLDFSAVPLTYGQVVALAGDFYGTPDLTPISSYPKSQAVDAAESAWHTLATAAASELQKILSIIGEEQAAIATARQGRHRPSSAYAALRKDDRLSYEWNEATGGAKATEGRGGLLPPPRGQGRYLKLAVMNLDHFGADAVRAYSACHRLALREAVKIHGADLGTPGAQADLRRAYAMNAFGDHFLTDLFASGHLRTPRRGLHEHLGLEPWAAGMLARLMHDEDNRLGLQVSNRQDDSWLAIGDGWELDPEHKDNFAKAVQAVQASVDEVAAAVRTGVAPTSFAALDLAPRLDVFAPKPNADSQDHSALFWEDSGTVLRRWAGAFSSGWNDTKCYHYEGWSPTLMLAEDAVNMVLPSS